MQMTRTTGRLAGLTATLLISTLTLAGCGDDSDSGSKSGDPGSSTASPSESESATESVSASPTTLDGDMIGAGYAYDLPDGWKDTTKQAKKLQATIDTAAAEAEPDDGFADNLNVGYNQVGAATLDQLEATVPDQLANLVKKGDLEVLPHTEIAGVEAIHHRAPAALGATKYYLEQYAAITDDGNLAIITFSFSREVPEAKRNEVISTVIDSWQWKTA
jgi:hypothetical protein